MTFVFNASPLIVLAKADLLERILDLPGSVLVPRPVAEEVGNCDDLNDPACRWLKQSETAAYLRDAPHASDFVAAWELGHTSSSSAYSPHAGSRNDGSSFRYGGWCAGTGR